MARRASRASQSPQACFARAQSWLERHGGNAAEALAEVEQELELRQDRDRRHIACKKRTAARAGWDASVLQEMRDRIYTQLRTFWDAGIRGPDFVWAATGPAPTSAKNTDGSGRSPLPIRIVNRRP
jgi:hypothetical protein